MKKIGIVLLIILIFPVFVSAGSFSSETGRANGYLQRDTFYSSYKKYLLYNNLKFGFNNGKPETNTSFTMGGFISEGEYKLTIPNKGSSYLLTGDSYWTLTPDGSKYIVIEYNGSNTNELNSYESGNTRPKARVTEYVAPNTSVSGTGRQTDPWIFDPMFRVDFEILGGHATINGSSEDEGKKLSNIYLRAKCKGTECTKTITLTIEDGYNFISDTCDGSYNYERNEYTVNNLTKDVECKLTIGIGKFHVNLVKGDWEETKVPSPDNVYLRQRENYYRENTYTNIIYKLDTNPERYGYTFKGYNIKDTTIRVIDNTGKFIDKTSIKMNNQEIISDWQKNIYTLTFNPNGGTINASETTKQVTFDEAYGVLPLATRAGYSFKGWYTSASNNEQIKSTDIVKYAGNRTLYAQWTICSVGTYNTGNKTTCTSCPTGYTSAQGSTAENQCYMNVPGGKYLTAKNSSAVNCPVGQYRSGTVKRYYGESVSCVDCTAGTYQNSTGQTSCKTCPNGYTSSVKATAENQCFMTVATGKYLTAKASSSTQCEAGTYRNGDVTKYYGESVSCTNCAAGTYSGVGASSCSNCAAGTYSGAKASSCTNCVAGTYSGAKASSCTNCAAGTYSGVGASSCSNCAAGTYSGAKASSCTNCVAGTYSGAKASSCTNCPAGTYSGAKASSCTNCPAGTYSGAKASSCTNCVAGTYSGAKASSCTNCPAGTYSGAKASSCTNCPAGTYSGAKATSCTNCAAGTYSGARASSCTNCVAGTYSGAKASACTNCPAGTYSGAKASSCTNCPAGTYSGAKASSCTNCKAGTYSGARASSCTNCPSDQWSNDRASSCFSRCNSVTYKVTSTCSKTCGGGTLKREAYSAYVSSYRCSAKDDWNGGSCNTYPCSPYAGYRCANVSSGSVYVFEYTGNCNMSGNTTNWKLKFLTSGTLKVNASPGNIDVFLVGGGSSGNNSGNSTAGGGGYTTTVTNVSISTTSYSITIGPGGAAVSGTYSNAGGTTSAFGYSAAGASPASSGNSLYGGSGGSGGGGNMGTGGSDGSSGGGDRPGSGCQTNGGCRINGQICTNTREFCEPGNTLYSGGGAAGHSYDKGGAGGGGTGDYSCRDLPCNGVANTGGGGAACNTWGEYCGAGGSGIVVIRNHR